MRLLFRSKVDLENCSRALQLLVGLKYNRYTVFREQEIIFFDKVICVFILLCLIVIWFPQHACFLLYGDLGGGVATARFLLTKPTPVVLFIVPKTRVISFKADRILLP